jgi:hypothetical protein
VPDRAPRPATRDDFLASVAAHLDLPDELAHGVLDELASHLRDATDELRERGLAAEDAERRAIERFGDARRLGGELSRARHERRQLLAAVGGGMRGLVVEGIRTWLFMAVVVTAVSVLAIPLAAAVIHAQGRSASSYLGGPLGSLVTVLAALAAAAYLGWVLPARVARPAIRSVRAVRRAVAVVGLVGGSTVLWLLLQVALDPVLAAGLPLVPVAFAVAALRAPERPTFRVGLVPAMVAAAVLCLPMTALAIVTATDSGQQDFMADTAPIGDVDPNSVGIAGVDWSMAWPDAPAQVTVEFTSMAEAARFTTLRLELWPARIVDGVVQFGREPVAVAAAPVPGIETVISYQVPRLRDPVTTATFVVGIRPDGGRTLLVESLDFRTTPPWNGTLLDWWAGRP